MPNEPDIGARLGLDISEYDRNIRAAIRDAANADKALDKLVNSANDAEKALNNIDGDIDVKIAADVSSLLEADKLAQGLDRSALIDLTVEDSALLYASGLIDDLDRTITPLVDIQTGDLLAAKTLLDDFNASLDVTLNIEDSELDKAATLIAQLDAQAPVVPLTIEDADITLAEQKIAALDAAAPSVKVSADDSEIASIADLLADIDSAAPSVKINVDDSEIAVAAALIGDLDADASAKINVDDSEVSSAKRKVDGLGGTETVKINADDAALDDVKTKLENLQTLAIIDLAINVADNIPSPEDIPLLGAIMAADAASRSIAAGLGNTVSSENTAQYQQGATDLYTSGFGTSQQEAADFYLQTVRATADEFGAAATTGENFTDIAVAGLTAAAVAGEDYNQVIRAAGQLVETGLASSYSEAFDQITTGFQSGLNEADDFLDTINEYAVQFDDLGFTTEQWFSMLQQGMDAGQFNTDFIADLVKEANIRAQAAIAGSGVEFDAISALGVLDEAEAFQAGEITGQEYLTGLFAAIEAGIADGSITPQTAFDALGTKAEDLTIEGVLELDPSQVETAFAEATGATSDAGDALYGGLESSIEEAKRLIETELATSLSDSLDIPGKIEEINQGIRAFATELRSGASIPDAIEVALNIPGFADGFGRLESAIGNIGLIFLDGIARLLDATGQQEAAAGVRRTIADAGATQLAFDLQFADDAEAVQYAVQQAVNRGVDGSVLGEQTQLAGSEMLAAGDLEGVATLVSSLQELQTLDIPPNVAAFLSGEGIDTADLESSRQAIEAMLETAGNLDLSGRGLTSSVLSDALASYDAASVAAGAVSPIRDALTTEIENLVASGDLTRAFDLASLIDPENLGAGIEILMQDAFAGLDLSGANLSDMLAGFDLATALGDDLSADAIRMSLEETFNAALAGGDFDIASQIAETLNIEELNTQLGVAAAEAGVSLDAITASSDAMATSVTTGSETAVTGITNLSNAATGYLPPAATAVGDMTTRISDLANAATGLGDGATKLGAFADAGVRLTETVTPADNAKTAITTLATETAAHIREATDEVDNFIYALLQINSLELQVPAVGLPNPAGGGGGGRGSNLYGGTIQSGDVSRVHGGETLVQAPRGADIAVLNAASSNTIYSAIAQLMAAGVGGGGGGSTTNVTNNLTFNNYGAASATAAGDTANQMRGY